MANIRWARGRRGHGPYRCFSCLFAPVPKNKPCLNCGSLKREPYIKADRYANAKTVDRGDNKRRCRAGPGCPICKELDDA
jgi:hypothetical protein